MSIPGKNGTEQTLAGVGRPGEEGGWRGWWRRNGLIGWWEWWQGYYRGGNGRRAGPNRYLATPLPGDSQSAWPPPVGARRFWVIQILIGASILVQELLWLPAIKGFGVGIPPFIAVGLFGVPVLYAALRFGLAATMATAVLAAFATIVTITINGILGHLPSVYTWAYVVEIASLLVVAAAVGSRVERQSLAQIAIEKAARAATLAEERYRSLFEVNSAPVLLVDQAGTIREVNEAARLAFSTRALFGAPVVDMVGDREARKLLHPAGYHSEPVHITAPDGRDYVLTATYTVVHSLSGDPTSEAGLVQVVFNDVTAEMRGQRRAEVYAKHVLQAQEDERRRIAQELHDEPVQSLVHLCHRIDLTMEAPELPESVGADLASTRGMVEAVIAELRNIATGLRPSVLDDLGLVASLRHLVAGRAADHGDDSGPGLDPMEGNGIDLRVSGSLRRLDKGQELVIYRIAQEALSNVERHAHASRVLVSLTFKSDIVRLVVLDDGTGFRMAPEEPLPDDRAQVGSDEPLAMRVFLMADRLGLAGMHERAQLVGGNLRVLSRPGAGTLVSLRLPVPPPNGVAVSTSPV